MSIRKRQIAISLNHNGVIGVDDKLLFSAPADLSKFAKFTDGTSIIAGRVTAQQMVNCGMRIKNRRPLIVITETGIIEGTCDQDDKWIYYVKNLQDALIQAEVLCLDLRLNGYTVAGGKRVYDDYLNLVDSGKVRPNAAYLFSHKMDPMVPAVALSRDFAQVRKLLEVRMAQPRYVWHEADVVGTDFNGKRVRAIEGNFGYLYDNREVDPYEVKMVESHARVETDGGEVSIDLFRITGWARKTEIKSVEIHTLGGKTITVRPRSAAGLNSLLFALNMTAFA
ncbi:dihydrofolate reductase [Pseudomonas phage nickie]|uniref:Dihydrofolate reductase n=1 Tax=Pseudomonas phage nickie TaxID=2048977 RepID=A0A2H4P7K9_9CAUD|nr:dihydrofolate reductase [Pseudomonas phage nickie]ATW58020.1 dihydrofolate reductase [Pseudomonas phage nickie]